MASISNLGVGSGLNLSDLYDSLETAENSKLTTITTQQTKYQSKITAIGQLQSALASLQTATDKLKSVDTFNATAVTSSNTAFSATTASSAVAGSYSIKVSQIAVAQTLISQPITDASKLGSTTGTSRTITISQGSGDPVNITLSDSETSLSSVVKAINNSGANVSATTIKGSDGNYRLLLNSKETGTDNDITLTVTGDDTLQAAIGYDSTASSNAMSVQTASQNAKLSVNGIDIESASNTISDALEGVTFTLKSASSSSETLVVDKSVDSVKSAITNFVTAYNKVRSVVGSVTKYTAVDSGADQSTSNGALLGDNTVRTVSNRLSSLLTEAQSGGSFAILAQMGITIDPSVSASGVTGNLVIDDTKLTDALTSNAQSVSQFFVGDGEKTGLGTQLSSTLSTMLSTSVGKEGIIKTATDGFNTQIDELADRYTKMQATIEATMARYKTQFTQLDTLMSQLNATSSYLTQQFSSTSSSSSSS
ncbi:flagellar filament capping protein FliD [Pantoea sp. GCM10028869]|uniref:flagellar filament capping protein FliD n=1 Tax=Pantoea sp. GCM10028869 TaxID=3273417 RepID=UPI00361A87C0